MLEWNHGVISRQLVRAIEVSFVSCKNNTLVNKLILSNQKR